MSTKTNHKNNKKSSAKIQKVSYHKKPENLSHEQWQIELRLQYGSLNEFSVENIGSQKFYSDFLVLNPTTQNKYKVAIRSGEANGNFCECMDFKTNGLGVCKHIGAVLHHLSNVRGWKKARKEGAPLATYSSVYLSYHPERKVKLRIGSEDSEEIKNIAKTYFDESFSLKENKFESFEVFLKKARQVNNEFRCYDDALSYIVEQRHFKKRKQNLVELIPNGMKDKFFNTLLKCKLFPYQKQGIYFAAVAGRSLIADEMGLGKTIQALGVAETLKIVGKINKVLIICPTSLKYQWAKEIEKFTNNEAHVIEGSYIKRKSQYQEKNTFYLIVSYHILANDLELINDLQPDLIILDEAQRIKNWNTKVANQVKKLESSYAVVLTGTPLENKLEEIYSIMQFVDPYKLGPLYRFLEKHQIKDEDTNKILGYKNLGEIGHKLSDVMIRRRKKDVLKQLPDRLDKNLFVPMTKEQMLAHTEYSDNVAQLVRKWQRFGFLREKDRQSLMINLNLMRMVCDSTFIIDQVSRYDTKVDEVINIVENAIQYDDTKLVIFSQWERMTRLIANELTIRDIKFEYLHGGIPSKERKDLLDNFRDDPACKVFLSTDAGGVGLNLQSASIIINCDIPWNPAVLEQRIGRIYRLGQKKNISVINLVSIGTIEHRMLDVLQFKSGMAKGVFDDGEETIFMSHDKFAEFMDKLSDLTGSVQDYPVDEGEEINYSVHSEETEEFDIQPTVETEILPGDDDVIVSKAENIEHAKEHKRQGQTDGPNQNAEELIKNGMNFLSGLVKTLSEPEASAQLVKSLTEKDDSGRTFLKIPIENEEIVNNAINVLGQLFKAFSK